MRILFLIDRLVGAGGTELHLWDLASELSARNFHVSVVSFNDGEFAKRFSDLSGIHYYCLNAPCIYNLKGLSALLWLRKFIYNEKIDVIQSFHTASDLAAPVLGLMTLGKATVISSRRDMGYTKASTHIFLHKFLNFFVTLILANSEQVKQAVIAAEGVTAEKIRVIYNGINAEKFLDASVFDREKYRGDLGIPENCVLVGALGNSRPVKGFSDLIQAAKQLVKIYPDICFTLAGESVDLRDSIEQAGLTDRFFLLGPIDNIGNYLSSLDIYVQPSHSEGFSNAVLEAMLAKCPVIVSAVGGNIEIVTHGEDGLLFQAKNIVDLVSKIEMVLSDAILSEKISGSAHEKVMNNFLLERMIDEYCDVYHEVCR